ncbi:hypothetical protein M422DRAFT_267517 [Sphaerobolus stellatus SS14]|uniref:Uncharacterized protein n=1 Tax=Sphaerobolus stellatus (strain SS14) TaxID=990650 RepID=A0A0C9UZY3_SPHS4|nr:hypothetical protein M422DRAFT_267517 [Sphaerobolus stellatus SS14]
MVAAAYPSCMQYRPPLIPPSIEPGLHRSWLTLRVAFELRSYHWKVVKMIMPMEANNWPQRVIGAPQVDCLLTSLYVSKASKPRCLHTPSLRPFHLAAVFYIFGTIVYHVLGRFRFQYTHLSANILVDMDVGDSNFGRSNTAMSPISVFA